MSSHDGLFIRAATKKDLPEILQLISELAEFEKLSHEMKASVALLERYLFSEKPAAEVLIGEFHSEVIGMALYFQNFSTFLSQPGLYLEDLYVRPQFRSRGFGGAFFRKLAEICVERNYGRFEWSVLDWNERAISFYKRMGAKAMDQWTVHRLSGEELRNFGTQSKGGR